MMEAQISFKVRLNQHNRQVETNLLHLKLTNQLLQIRILKQLLELELVFLYLTLSISTQCCSTIVPSCTTKLSNLVSVSLI